VVVCEAGQAGEAFQECQPCHGATAECFEAISLALVGYATLPGYVYAHAKQKSLTKEAIVYMPHERIQECHGV